MKNLVIISMFLLSCNVFLKKDIENTSTFDYGCSKCDSLINNTIFFNYPDRFISRLYIGSSETIDSHSMKIQYWTNEWETSELWKPDTLNVYTHKEFEYLKKFRFCFLGRTKNEIRQLLQCEKEYPVRDGLALMFNTGAVRRFCNDKKPLLFESDENGCEYGISGEKILLFPYFSKKGGGGVFLGTHQDSINLESCKNNSYHPIERYKGRR